MKISTQNDSIYIENASNAPEISDNKINNANRIFEIINKKVKKLNNKSKKNINIKDFIHNKALEKIETLRNLNYSKEEKIKKIFNYIHWYYISIAGDFEQEGIKISIPDIFRQIIENPNIIEIFDIIICGDNPGTKEYEDDRGFNPNAKAGSILKTLLNTNFIQDENVLFYNKTFISTPMTKDLGTIVNKKLVKNTVEFNAKTLNLLKEILNKPVLVLGGQNESVFKIFFKSISKDIKLAPHTSMYKIFGKNKSITGWDEKFNMFKNKYKNIDIFSEGGYLSFKKLENLDENGKNILIDYFNNVVLN